MALCLLHYEMKVVWTHFVSLWVNHTIYLFWSTLGEYLLQNDSLKMYFINNGLVMPLIHAWDLSSDASPFLLSPLLPPFKMVCVCVRVCICALACMCMCVQCTMQCLADEEDVLQNLALLRVLGGQTGAWGRGVEAVAGGPEGTAGAPRTRTLYHRHRTEDLQQLHQRRIGTAKITGHHRSS